MSDGIGRVTEAAALQETEKVAFLHSLLDSSTEYSIVAKDLEGNILAWNEGARRTYGYEPAEVVGKGHAFILHDPEDVRSGRARSILEEARRAGKWEGEMCRDPAGRPLGFTMVSRDLTESERITRLRADGARDELTKSLNVRRLLAVLDDTLNGAGGKLDHTRTERGAEAGAE